MCDVGVADMSAEWRPLSEAPVDRECVVCNIFTGVMAISSHDDKPDRRGWNHRNGFNATHFLSGIPDLPTLPEDINVAIQVLEAHDMLEEADMLRTRGRCAGDDR